MKKTAHTSSACLRQYTGAFVVHHTNTLPNDPPYDSWCDWAQIFDDTGGTVVLHINAVPPLFWDDPTHTLSIQAANASHSGVVSTLAQPFAGTKTFIDIPQCSIIPTQADDLANKAYVDSLIKGLSWQDEIVSFWDFAGGNPPGVVEGNRYISSTNHAPFTQWRIYQYTGGIWIETIPEEGYALYDEDTNLCWVYNGTTWVNLGTSIQHSALLGLINDDHLQYFMVNGRAGQGITLNSGDSPSLYVYMYCQATTGKFMFHNYGTSSYEFTSYGASGGDVIIQSTTASTSTTTGALQVAGGLGIAKHCYIGGNCYVLSPDAASNVGISVLNTSGNIYFTPSTAGSIYTFVKNTSAGDVVIQSTTSSGATSQGALRVAGGVGIAGVLNAASIRALTTGDNQLLVLGLSQNLSAGQSCKLALGKEITVTNSLCIRYHHVADSDSGNNATLGFWNTGYETLQWTTTFAKILTNTAATSTTTGALQVVGGVGVQGDMYLGGALNLSSQLIISLSGSPPSTPAISALAPSTGSSTNWVSVVIGKNGSVNNEALISWVHFGDGSSSNALQFTIKDSGASLQLDSLRAFCPRTTASTDYGTGALVVSGGVGIAGAVNTHSIIKTDSTTAATSYTTGAIIDSGGLGVAGDAYFNGIIFNHCAAPTALDNNTWDYMNQSFTFNFYRIGMVVVMWWGIQSGTLTDNTSTITWNSHIPSNFQPATDIDIPIIYVQQGGWGTGFIELKTDGTLSVNSRPSLPNFTNTYNLTLRGSSVSWRML